MNLLCKELFLFLLKVAQAVPESVLIQIVDRFIKNFKKKLFIEFQRLKFLRGRSNAQAGGKPASDLIGKRLLYPQCKVLKMEIRSSGDDNDTVLGAFGKSQCLWQYLVRNHIGSVLYAMQSLKKITVRRHAYLTGVAYTHYDDHDASRSFQN